ncbi:purine-nucleoside phosphorylase [Chelativorans sp. AA-79]|uniref:purine-nucleoside phosphorylase n=1 Tax=Chelativorans sp. AA-79 TaxID=3028735 RepID=UPI0023F88DC5|nr:purine-nucleoside phosphorylase [Chelativorans sp. AA-79]WEX08834.1 purine-nucleoside phosphorylase [Chelativorans sp. AA-79]
MAEASQIERLNRAHKSVADCVGAPVEIAIVLGSGLGDLARGIKDATIIPYADIQGFPVATAPGHKGQLIVGTLHGRRVAAMQGRLHLYEGWTPRDIALAIYLLDRLGSTTLVVTNAAGALNPDYRPGDVMLIEDHLNFTGTNPLVGPNDGEIGLRFPDMARAYDPDLLELATDAADRTLQPVHRGIYAGILGPSLETLAERRFLRAAGGDAVGMSTVTEVIAAAHAGLRVVGISAITNAASGWADEHSDTVEEVFAHTAVSGEKIDSILQELLPLLPRRLD